MDVEGTRWQLKLRETCNR